MRDIIYDNVSLLKTSLYLGADYYLSRAPGPTTMTRSSSLLFHFSFALSQSFSPVVRRGKRSSFLSPIKLYPLQRKARYHSSQHQSNLMVFRPWPSSPLRVCLYTMSGSESRRGSQVTITNESRRGGQVTIANEPLPSVSTNRDHFRNISNFWSVSFRLASLRPNGKHIGDTRYSLDLV